MNITINSNTDIFYNQLLELLSSFKPIKNLREREITILAEIMKQHYVHKDVTKNENLRRNLVFSRESKQAMCNKLGISRDSLNNNLSILRKKNIMSKDNFLIKTLNIFPDKEFTFAITFKLKDNE